MRIEDTRLFDNIWGRMLLKTGGPREKIKTGIEPRKVFELTSSPFRRSTPAYNHLNIYVSLLNISLTFYIYVGMFVCCVLFNTINICT